jgi:glycolate oxidase
VELGGTITGEHGVGIEKINQMCVQFSPEELAAFFGVKAAFDPAGLLNPGKAIPTLNAAPNTAACTCTHGRIRIPRSERTRDLPLPTGGPGRR